MNEYENLTEEEKELLMHWDQYYKDSLNEIEEKQYLAWVSQNR